MKAAACLAVACLCLAACSSSPPDTLPVSVAGLSPHRARLVSAALDEWTAWGKITLTGWPEKSPLEADPALFERVLTYWSAVPIEGPGVIRQHRALHAALSAQLDQQTEGTMLRGPAISLWAWPAWSAAFISHEMAKSNVPSFVFPPSASHAAYVDALLAQALNDAARAPFLPHAPQDYAPQPGDLLCSDRSGRPLMHWTDRLAEAGQYRPMHCDIVVSSARDLVQAVGGNVLDVVALRIFPADGGGRALPPPWDKPPFFLVLENRLDAP